MNNDLISNESQPTRADAIKNRALLVDTAQRLFAEKGVDKVSMSDIAEAAGVGKGTLYRHFENKTAICHALLDCETRDLQEHSLRRLQQNGDPFEDLSWFLEQVARFVSRNGQLLCAGSRETSESTLEHPAHAWWRKTIRGLLQRMNLSGDLDYKADVLYIMLDVHTIHYQMNTLSYDISRIIDGLISTLRHLSN
jgi:AcrR family transcriptional regulator